MNDARPSHRDNAPGGRAPRTRTDTIVAVSTATGRSAIAIVRVSGPDAERIGRTVISPWPLRARTMARCAVRDPAAEGRVLDDGLAVVFPAPGSYTGETILEVHTHGGSYIPGAVLEAFVIAGARPALPGEFTERAVLNGKLDLVEAEAIGELIDARTAAAHRSAVHAVSGSLSRAYAALRDEAIEVEALLAYDIDFPDEDHGPVAHGRVEQAASTLSSRIKTLVDSAPAATLARNGAVVVLAGPPNAGKSTLFNALAGETRAIVSDEPGTTRDAIETLLDGDPWPLRLVDTAGLRPDPGVVERLGIEVSERYLRSADVVVLCADSDASCDNIRGHINRLSGATVLLVRTKADLFARDSAKESENSAQPICALTGYGVGKLLTRIMAAISARVGDPGEFPVIAASARQRAALRVAGTEIGLFLDAWNSRALPAPVAATHLRAATTALNELIGVIDSDGILSRVFSTFCVGK